MNIVALVMDGVGVKSIILQNVFKRGPKKVRGKATALSTYFYVGVDSILDTVNRPSLFVFHRNVRSTLLLTNLRGHCTMPPHLDADPYVMRWPFCL